jgi:hypothetical protein
LSLLSQLSSDSADFLATRPHTAAVIPGKPVVNPLQFVKVCYILLLLLLL